MDIIFIRIDFYIKYLLSEYFYIEHKEFFDSILEPIQN